MTHWKNHDLCRWLDNVERLRHIWWFTGRFIATNKTPPGCFIYQSSTAIVSVASGCFLLPCHIRRLVYNRWGFHCWEVRSVLYVKSSHPIILASPSCIVLSIHLTAFNSGSLIAVGDVYVFLVSNSSIVNLLFHPLSCLSGLLTKSSWNNIMIGYLR